MNFAPFNKWIVMKPIDETDKVGMLYLPGNIANQYRRAIIVALPKISEVEYLAVGTVVFYDTLGEVRIGRGKDETILVSYLNVLGTISQDEVA